MRLEVVELEGYISAFENDLSGLGATDSDTRADVDYVKFALAEIKKMPAELQDFFMAEIAPEGAPLDGDLGGWFKKLRKRAKKAVKKIKLGKLAKKMAIFVPGFGPAIAAGIKISDTLKKKARAMLPVGTPAAQVDQMALALQQQATPVQTRLPAPLPQLPGFQQLPPRQGYVPGGLPSWALPAAGAAVALALIMRR